MFRYVWSPGSRLSSRESTVLSGSVVRNPVQPPGVGLFLLSLIPRARGSVGFRPGVSIDGDRVRVVSRCVSSTRSGPVSGASVTHDTLVEVNRGAECLVGSRGKWSGCEAAGPFGCSIASSAPSVGSEVLRR